MRVILFILFALPAFAQVDPSIHIKHTKNGDGYEFWNSKDPEEIKDIENYFTAMQGKLEMKHYQQFIKLIDSPQIKSALLKSKLEVEKHIKKQEVIFDYKMPQSDYDILYNSIINPKIALRIENGIAPSFSCISFTIEDEKGKEKCDSHMKHGKYTNIKRPRSLKEFEEFFIESIEDKTRRIKLRVRKEFAEQFRLDSRLTSEVNDGERGHDDNGVLDEASYDIQNSVISY